jgi:protein SCO1/2
MRTPRKLAVLIALCAPLVASMAGAEEKKMGKPIEVGVEEQLGEQVPLNLTYSDEDGNDVALRDLIDKPTILALVYFECPGICTPLLNGLTEVLGKLDLKPGVDYQVVTVSFDPTETPKMAKGKRQNYLKQFRKPFPESAWHFLTGTQKSIDRLTDAVGFRYKRQGEQDFVHAAVLTVLSSEGKVARYVYGTSFLPFEIQMALTEAAAGRTGSAVNRVLLYCFSYDPVGHKYLLSVTRLTGFVTVLFAGSFGLWLFLSGRRKAAAGDPRLKRAAPQSSD